MASVQEKRREERIRLEIPVLLENGSGTSRDISTSGIYFVTNQPLVAGNPVSFTVNLDYAFPGKPLKLDCQGQVLRSEAVDESGELFGIAASIRECWCLH